MKTLIMLLCLSTAVCAQPKESEQEKEKGKITMTARLPPFVEPLVLEENEGKIEVVGEDVCYDDVAHESLLTYLYEVKPASDKRAFKAWSNGYVDGYEHGARKAIDIINRRNKLKISSFSDIMNNKFLWLTIGAVTAYVAVEFTK